MTYRPAWLGPAALVLGLASFVPAQAVYAQDPPVIGALGDSLSAGFNAKHFGDNRELSWATGTDPAVNSILQRLDAMTGKSLQSYNEAIAGSVIDALPRQVDRLLVHEPDYVTITIGANDVCTWAPDYQAQLAHFEKVLRNQIVRIVAVKPQVRIFVATIPDLYNLWTIAVDRQGCQARWDLFNICRPLLDSHKSPDDRQAFVRRWELANEALDRVSREFPANIVHDPSAAHTRFEWHHVSGYDCFHPSVDGQNLLADKAWDIYAHSGL